MNLTTKGRYAVTAMVDLALHGDNTPESLANIASRQGIAANYLEQIFMKLRKNGLVRSVRGPGGGYILAHDSEVITVADIVAAVDESIKMTRCNTSAESCNGTNVKCLTHHLWVGLGKQIENYLKTTTLADVCIEHQPKEKKADVA